MNTIIDHAKHLLEIAVPFVLALGVTVATCSKHVGGACGPAKAAQARVVPRH